jgi:hypothetical protein
VILACCDPSVKGAGGTLLNGDMEIIKKARLTAFDLHNFHDDVSQTKDLAQAEPQRLQPMSDRLGTLCREVIAEGPIWMVADVGPKKKKD